MKGVTGERRGATRDAHNVFALFSGAEPCLAIGWNCVGALSARFGDSNVFDEAYSQAFQAGAFRGRGKRSSALQAIVASEKGFTIGCFCTRARH